MNSPDLERRVAKMERAITSFGEELRLAWQYIQPDAASSLTKSRVVLEKLVVSIYTQEMSREPRKPRIRPSSGKNRTRRIHA